MDGAGARTRAVRLASALRRSRTRAALRRLACDLSAALRARSRPLTDVRTACRVLCEEMSARRAGRPVVLRFERFPDEIEVTGLWVEFQDFDLVIVEERAEAMQQLVILGHELWHMHAGHRHHAPAGARRVLAGDAPDWDTALVMAARHGSREADEAEADEFGHRMAAAVRPLLDDRDTGIGDGLVQRALGYRGGKGTRR
ncbi:toxin-antitoxin system, toxin component family protein [Streptomyces sp. NPDC102347]|uniref:toxin-antitoxin system, toxin component family protein n=1 Tax=Streptomyces sp. NPDC102347 TaxID=3366157 RepID=UPI00380D6B06